MIGLFGEIISLHVAWGASNRLPRYSKQTEPLMNASGWNVRCAHLDQQHVQLQLREGRLGGSRQGSGGPQGSVRGLDKRQTFAFSAGTNTQVATARFPQLCCQGDK